VERRHLLVDDLYGNQRRLRRWHATSGLRRLVIIGRSGFISLDALSWLHATKAALVHLDPAGELIATSIAGGPDIAALRRAQALAATGPVGVQVARHVLRMKVDGQRSLLRELPGGAHAAGTVEAALDEIDSASDLPSLLLAESMAAAAYWQAWAKLALPFPRRDLDRIPGHWSTFGARSSLITGGPRTATNPANALANLLYSCLEFETVLACHEIGLDPGVGIFHTDRRDRASLALDLMEAVRPVVDAYLLALLTERSLSAREFVETRQGACRISPRFAEQLVPTCEVWRNHVGPVVEDVAHMLAEHAPANVPQLTPLTLRNRRRALDGRLPDRRQRGQRSDYAVLPSTCVDCGATLADRRRRYCDGCRSIRITRRGDRGRANAQTVLAQLRAEQRDPAHGGRAAEIRGAKNAAHQRAVHAWTGESPDPATFKTEILPALRQCSIPDLMEVTGLSEHYCSLIRLGKRVPHARHWAALRQAAPRS
jgi:CRISPR-associated endonuclease Cas1